MKQRIAIEWKNGKPQGHIEFLYGSPGGLSIARGSGKATASKFAFTNDGPSRLLITIADAKIQSGAEATIITVRMDDSASIPLTSILSPGGERKSKSRRAAQNYLSPWGRGQGEGCRSFSFWLRDVTRDSPILIPGIGVVVTEAGDARSYSEIEAVIRNRGSQTNIQRIESEPEETFENAAKHVRDMKCETWLGLSRDMRIFAVRFRSQEVRWDSVQPKFHGMEIKEPKTAEFPLKYGYMMGRGMGCTNQLSRHLEDGVLPILHTRLVEGDVQYHQIAFTTLESRPLTAKNVRGTHFLVADGHGHGHMLTESQKKEFDARLPEEINRDEEVIYCCQVKAINTAPVPRYAWMYMPGWRANQWILSKEELDADGFAVFEAGRVYCVNRLNGKPLAQREIAVLLQPGETATFEFFIPHQHVSRERAKRLTKLDFTKKHAECRAYWVAKLDEGARLRLPERRVDEMARAGLLHLDLVTYGLEPKGTLAATIGHYNPIGSESSPIIQFFDSMGWHDVAERSLQYFLDKQHDDGFIQNFGGYMLETGAALWSMGEHWRYTRDTAWLKRSEPKLLKSCDYIIRWRERNKRPELKGKGYGMIDGKVGDPEDPYHIFMLNGYAYLGLARMAEALAKLNPKESKRLAREAAALRADIRTSFFEGVAKAPAVPVGDGTWCPTAPPWAEEERGPVCLYAQKGKWYSHGTFFCRDSMIGAPYLVLQEVLGANEPVMDWMMNYHADLMTDRNVGFSQPYYCRHDWTHLKRGEVKAFLKTYYNGFASLADRETYTFWEHYFGASPHKTHEEGWFLMQTRWMLWMEEGDTLNLLPGIPRAWLEHGETIELKNVASYFGPVTLRVESKVQQGVIEATVECKTNRQPKVVNVRLPHAQGAKAKKTEGGKYCTASETVCVERFRNSAKITLRF